MELLVVNASTGPEAQRWEGRHPLRALEVRVGQGLGQVVLEETVREVLVETKEVEVVRDPLNPQFPGFLGKTIPSLQRLQRPPLFATTRYPEATMPTRRLSARYFTSVWTRGELETQSTPSSVPMGQSSTRR